MPPSAAPPGWHGPDEPCVLLKLGLAGQGGLPVGVSGRGVVLMSGGR